MRAVLQEGAQLIGGGGGQPRQVLGRRGGALGQDDVVAVAEHLVVAQSAFDREVDGADLREAVGEPGEVAGADQQFGLLLAAALHLSGKRADGGAHGQPAAFHGTDVGGEQIEVPDVPDHDPAAVRDEGKQALDHILQVQPVREVLHDGVDDDGVELLRPRRHGHGPGVTLAEGDVGPAAAVGPATDPGQGRGGDVERVHRFAGFGVAEEEEPGSAADLQQAPGPERFDLPDRAVDPLPHLGLGDGLPGVAAVPADQAGLVGGVVLGRAGVLVLEELLPLLEAFGVLVPGGGVEPFRCGLYVRDEPLGLARGLGGDDGAPYGGVGQQRVLDLAELDAEAPHLHLVVGAADELQGAVGQPSGQVARTVQPGAGLVGEGVGDEPEPGEFRVAEIAACHAGAAHAQFPDDTARHRPQALVEHVRGGPGDGPADRDDGVLGDVPGDDVAGGGDAVLGGAVGVDDGQSGMRPVEPEYVLRGERLAAHAQVLQRQAPPLRGFREGREEGRRQGHHGDARALHPVEQMADVLGVAVVQDQPAAGQQRTENLLRAHVERDRRVVEHDGGGGGREVVGVAHQTDDAALLHENTLGEPGGTRGEDDVGKVVGGEPQLRPGQVALRPVGEHLGAVVRAFPGVQVDDLGAGAVRGAFEE